MSMGKNDSLKTDNMPCKVHKKKMNTQFCHQCDIPVCPECISAMHNKHEMQPLDKAYIEKLEKLKKFQTRVSNELKFCQAELSDLQTIKIHSGSKYEYLTQEINKMEQAIKDTVTKYAEKLRNQIETEKRTKNNLMTEKRAEIEAIEKSLKEKSETLKSVMATKNTEKVFELAASTFKDENKLVFKKLPLEMNFVPGTVTTKSVAILFGSLKPIISPDEQSQINFKVLKTFTTDWNYIYRIRSEDENSTWISNYGKGTLHKMHISDNIKTVKEFSADIFDMSIMPGTGILLSMRDSSEVKLLTSSGKIETVLSVSPLLPRAIHVTKNNDIILGLTDSGDLYQLTAQSCRKLLMFKINGKQKHEMAQNVFTLPTRIMTNLNNDMVVVDAISDNDGRVVVLGQDGSNIKWTYQGHPTINAEDKLFDPRDIATTSEGHVIVADCDNCSFHVLSREGTLLTCQIMREHGIIFPYSLDIDKTGQVWVGCDTYKDKNDAKIHIVKFSY